MAKRIVDGRQIKLRGQRLKEGQPIWIVFRDGHSVTNSQGRPKFYMTENAKNTYAPWDTTIVEYVPIVRCDRCVHWLENMMLGNGDCYCALLEKYMSPDSFCSCGEKEVFN